MVWCPHTVGHLPFFFIVTTVADIHEVGTFTGLMKLRPSKRSSSSFSFSLMAIGAFLVGS